MQCNMEAQRETYFRWCARIEKNALRAGAANRCDTRHAPGNWVGGRGMCTCDNFHVLIVRHQ